ncbi:MAG TPA: PA14 domain-containing protein [Aggregatilineales bacterium]|nr:SH3 domain-containing protein [Anaerolineales bacterium]HRE47932.1 PA14 domain-containing protein [Aggregatilineales bacterium]
MRKLYSVAAFALAVALFVTVLVMPAPAAHAQGQTGSNWTGFYWNNTNFSGSPAFSRIDPAINFNWASGSPVPGIINADNFSVRWSNRIFFTAGTYRFRAGADDGIRVAINGQLIINRFSTAPGAFTINTADVSLAQGDYEIIVDYFEGVGDAGVLFDWLPISAIGAASPTPVGTAFFATPIPVVPTVQLTPKGVVIVDKANVRSGPGVNYPVVAELFRDTTVLVAARNGIYGMETWFLINLPSGGQGWIYRRVFYPYNIPADLPTSAATFSAPEGSGQPGDPVVAYEARGVAKVNVTVRSAPSTRTGTRLGVIPKGGAFLITKLSTNRAWVKVIYDNLTGWVYIPNITTTTGGLGQLPRGND